MEPEEKKVLKAILSEEFLTYRTFLEGIGINIIEEYKCKYIKLHPILKINNTIERIKSFQKNLILWYNWEKSNGKIGVLSKKFKYKNITFNKIQDIYCEFKIGSYLMRIFGTESIKHEYQSIGNKNVDFVIMHENEKYFIEIKNLHLEDKLKSADDGRLVELNSNRLVQKFSGTTNISKNSNKGFHSQLPVGGLNIIFLNFQIHRDNYGLLQLKGSNKFYRDENSISYQIFESDGFLNTTNGKKIGAILDITKYDLDTLKITINPNATNIIKGSFLNNFK